MRNKILLTGGAMLLIIIAFGIWQQYPSKSGKVTVMQPSITVIPFQNGDGWGYDIKVDTHTLIHQNIIPAVSGLNTFRSREEALRVGNRMAEKLRKGIMPPGISLEELKEMNISIPEASQF